MKPIKQINSEVGANDLNPYQNKTRSKRNGKREILNVSPDAMKRFRELTGLDRMNEIDDKTDEWAASYELNAILAVSPKDKIDDILEQYMDQMPNDIRPKRIKRLDSSFILLCLRRNAIDRFCEITGFKRADERNKRFRELTGLVRKSDGFRSGAKNVGALDSLQETKRKTKTDNQKKK